MVTTTRNAFGELVYGSEAGVAVPVSFREGSSYQDRQFMETIDADCSCYAPYDAPFSEGAIFIFNSLYYRTVKIVQAKGQKSGAVQFLKVYFKRDRGLIS